MVLKAWETVRGKALLNSRLLRADQTVATCILSTCLLAGLRLSFIASLASRVEEIALHLYGHVKRANFTVRLITLFLDYFFRAVVSGSISFLDGTLNLDSSLTSNSWNTLFRLEFRLRPLSVNYCWKIRLPRIKATRHFSNFLLIK